MDLSSDREAAPALHAAAATLFGRAGEQAALARALTDARLGASQMLMVSGEPGIGMLQRVVEAFPEARRRVPGLRMVAVAGPRIDPTALPQHDGLEVRAYVHDLYRHLAACDPRSSRAG